MFRKLLFLLTLFLGVSCLGYLSFFSICAAGQAGFSEVFDEVNSFDGVIGLYAKNLKTGKTICFQDSRIFPTASTSKLIVALAVYKYIYPLASDDQKNFYDDTIKLMIERSDNGAFYTLLSVIDDIAPAALTNVVSDLGLQQTMIHSGEAFRIYQYHSVTTPREMAVVLECLFNNQYIDYIKSEELKNELANTIFQDEIPRYMTGKVMHKVGELDAVLCDVGIIDDGKDQVLISIFTITQRPHSYASDVIAGISAKTFAVLKNPDDT